MRSVKRVSSVSRMGVLNKYKYEVIMDIVSRVRRVSSMNKVADIVIKNYKDGFCEVRRVI